MERIPFVRSKAQLLGYRTEPNEVVPILEQALGIVFQDPPALIELTPRNSAVPHFKLRVLSKGKIEADAAQFDSMINSALVGTHARSIQTILMHEALHGWSHSLNPELLIATDVKSAFSGLILGFPNELWQLLIAYKCLGEGLADFGALKSAEFLGINDSYTWKMREGLHEKEKHRSSLAEVVRELPASISRMKGLEVSADSVEFVYSVGLCFVKETVDHFLGANMQLGAALKVLVQDPPINVMEVTHPEIYLQRREQLQ